MTHTHQDHNHQDCDSHHHNHNSEADHTHDSNNYTLILSIALFLLGISLDFIFKPAWFQETPYLRFSVYLLSYILVGYAVWKNAIVQFLKFDFFNEFSLMGIATLGAFILKEYPEGVAVMLFYTVGELFQEAAVNNAKKNIKNLLDVRPTTAFVLRSNGFVALKPEQVIVGDHIQVRVGEKVSLDGELLTDKGSFNTAALTGESKPATYTKGQIVLAGMLNLDQVVRVKVTKKYEDSSLSKILQMVQEATSRKAPSELMIRKFAKIYTPIVFALAVLVILLPYFIFPDYNFNTWFYRALVFLVISCPCALVISIPLGYFGGIGAASRHGILFKGANYLDLMTQLDVVVMDKTGTLTEGVFKVQKVVAVNGDQDQFVSLVAALEKQSTHPIAKAVVAYAPNQLQADNVEEIAGMGLTGSVAGKRLLVGNTKLLTKFSVAYPQELDQIVESLVVVAIDNVYSGHIVVADQVKSDASKAISDLKNAGIKQTVVLSGDKNEITQKVARELGVDIAYGGLLPEQKVAHVQEIKNKYPRAIAFVGDGLNDAPVLALSDVGIAMGGLGSDAAIETADVVIQTDQPSKIATAIAIGKATKKVVFQNISIAFIVKAIVLVLGAGGIATMWEAVFADVGVALLAILNAMRVQWKKYE
ncbi:MAG: cadmium-translocating P-type ATPase [Flavobacterium sp.]|nr:cadmium-translocating P-type ATPase [Candidatus Neoflavobacterium equi]